MDKVKEILVVARKHHFWILCGVAALAAIAVWSMATSKLSAEFASRQSTIKTQESSLSGFPSPHPNETWTAGMQAETAKEKESVRAAWTRLFQDQKEKVYQWPASLNKDFLDEIVKVEEGRQKDLAQARRVRYQRQVVDFAKSLPKIVDSAVAEEASTGLGGGSSPTQPAYPVDKDGNPIYPDHKVVWDPQSQQEIFATFTWEKPPSTTMVRHAQEELWVYEALCKAIAEVNQDARGSHDAPITAITQMAIAYMAHEDGASGGSFGSDRIMRVAQAAPSAEGDPAALAGPPAGIDGAPGEGGGGSAPDPRQRGKEGSSGARGGGLFGTPGAEAAADPAAAADPDEIWKGWRYVGLDGKPLTTAAEVEASALEYNLMPFRVRLMINPKEIDRLLIACRNSAMPIEVREVRVGQPQNAGAGGVGGGRMGGIAPPRGPAGGVGPRPTRSGFGEGGEYGGGPTGPAMPAGLADMPQQKTVSLEINGVVYIVKKPDPSLLDSAAPSADGGTTPPVDPAAAPVAPTVWNRFERPWPMRNDAIAWARRPRSSVALS